MRAVLLLAAALVGAFVGWYAGTLVGVGLISMFVFADGGAPASYPTLLIAAALGALGGGTLAWWLDRLAWRAGR